MTITHKKAAAIPTFNDDDHIINVNLASEVQGILPVANGGTGATSPQNSVVYQFDIPLIIAPTGSIADNGVLTSGTANPLTYLKTYTWFPTGAIFTASVAGWYWTVWTTTTAATIYQETWNGTSDPVAIASPTAWVKTGPGAFTGPTTEAVYATLALAAASVTSRYALEIETQHTNNANAKTLKARMTDVNGTTLASYTLTSFLHAKTLTVVKVNGVADKQRVTAELITAAAIARQTPALAAETTSAAWAIALSFTKATATDVAVLETVRLTQSR